MVLMPFPWFVIGGLLAFGAVLLFAWFSAALIAYRKLNNAGIVDVFWGYGFALLALAYGWIAYASGWFGLRHGIVVAMFTLASIRLGTYLFKRFCHWHPKEDPRYSALVDSWEGKNVLLKMAGVYALQGTLMWLVSIPLVFSLADVHQKMSFLAWVAVGVWLLGFIGEALADWQLQRFLVKPENQGKICGTDVSHGLWYVSRHPNYFCEWLMWLAYWLFACATAWGWVTVFSPVLMLLFLLFFTGIKPSEERSLQTKGNAYREYQATTSAFVPWFKRQIKA